MGIQRRTQQIPWDASDHEVDVLSFGKPSKHGRSQSMQFGRRLASQFASSITTTSRRIGFCDKLLLLIRRPKAMTNRAAEICILLLALYIVLEFQNIPQKCTHLASCLQNFTDAGGDLEAPLVLQSCGAQRLECYLSRDTREQSQGRIDDFNAMCDCLLSREGNVFCSFRISTMIFLVLGIFIVTSLELTDDGRESDPSTPQKPEHGLQLGPRRIANTLTLLYLVAFMIFYQYITDCNGPEFEEQRRVIVFVALACFLTMTISILLEEIGEWMHRPTHHELAAQRNRDLMQVLFGKQPSDPEVTAV